VTNASGAVALTREYDTWGNLEAGVTEPGYAFTGREWDPEIGLYYYRARYYDPRVGTFISEDSVGVRTGDNRYAYVEGDPAGSVDPSGHYSVDTGNRGFDRQIREAVAKLEEELLIEPDAPCCLTHFTRYGVDIFQWLKAGGPPIISSGKNWSYRKHGETNFTTIWINYEHAMNLSACHVAGDILHEMGHYASHEQYQTVEFSTDCTFGCLDVGPPHDASGKPYN
jgi:RHS repeat-associated protein